MASLIAGRVLRILFLNISILILGSGNKIMFNQPVIVVEDDVGFGRLIKRVLSGMGHKVEHFTAPSELIDRYDEIAPNIIFLDIFMPEMDGLEVAKWLLDKGFDGKLVFMTGHDRTFLDAARAVMWDSEADVVTLEKPARIDQIRDLLREQRGKPNKGSPTGTAIAG